MVITKKRSALKYLFRVFDYFCKALTNNDYSGLQVHGALALLCPFMIIGGCTI